MNNPRGTARPGRDATQRVEGFVRVLFAFEASLYSALTPMLPHYAHALSASEGAIGVLAATYPAGIMGGALIGRLIARGAGLRRTMIVALIAFAVSSAAFGFANGIFVLGSLRFIEGMACGCLWGSGLAWLVSISAPSRRGSAIGSALAGAGVGTLIGPAIGTLALALGTQRVFSGVAAVGVLLALRMRRYPDAPELERTERTRWLTVGRSPRLLLGLWLVLLGASEQGALGTLLPLRLARIGASSGTIGATFLLASVLSTAVARMAGRSSDRSGPRVPLTAGLGMSAILIVMLLLPQTVVPLAAVIVLTLGGALTTYLIPGSAYLTSASESLGIALMTGTMLWNFAWSTGEMIGAPVASMLSEAAGDALPLLLLAALMLTTLLAVQRLRPTTTGIAQSASEIRAPDVKRRLGDEGAMSLHSQ